MGKQATSENAPIPVPVTDIDRRKFGRRIVPMQVLCFGLPRTGSSSLREALRLLGYHDVYHGASAWSENPRDCELWLEALRAKYCHQGREYGREDFDRLLGHCQAAMDQPATLFAKELLDFYPDAKVVMTMRDYESWTRSNTDTIMRQNPYYSDDAIALFAKLVRSPDRFVFPCIRLVSRILYRGDFNAHSRAIYDEHHAFIRSIVPADRLLEYRVKEGWEPLCRFLGREAPDAAFPHVNDTESMNAGYRQLQLIRLRTAMTQLFNWAAYIWVIGMVVVCILVRTGYFSFQIGMIQ